MKLLSCSLILISLAAAAHADAPRPRAGADTGIVAESAMPAAQPRRPRAGTPVAASPSMVADTPCGHKYCNDPEIVAGTVMPAG